MMPLRPALWSLLIPVALIACNGGPSDDTDVDTDTDTDTDTEARPDGADLTFVLDTTDAGYAVGLLQVDSQQNVIGTFAAAASVEGEATLSLGQVPVEDLEYQADLGTEVALFLPYVFEDLDGDEAKDEDEPVVGAGDTIVAWVESVNGTLVLLGIQPGWNALDVSTETPSTYPRDNIPISVNLLPVTTLSATADVDDSLSVDGRRLAIVSGVSIDAGGALDTLSDQALTDPITFTVDGAPPASHVVEDADIEGLATELPVAYIDADESGGPSEADTGQVPVCHDARAVVLIWLPQPTLPEQVFSYVDAGLRPGWLAFHADDIEDGGAPLVQAELDALTIDETCVLPE